MDAATAKIGPRRPLAAAAVRALPWLALGALALAVRLAPWPYVFPGGGRVQLTHDTDGHYHVLRASRALATFPAVPARDPAMNHPHGAEIIWPPLFDAALAAAGLAAGGTPADVERTAPFAPLLAGLAGIAAAVAVAAALLGRAAALAAGAVLALLPAHAAFTSLGRPDQHAAELLLATGVLGAFALAAREHGGRRALGWEAALALCATLAFWTWHGSGLYLALLGAAAAVAHVVAPGETRPARALARGAGLAAVGLVLSLALVRPGALARVDAMGITALAPLLAGATAAFGAILLAAARRRGGPASSARGAPARALEVLAAGAIAGALLLAVPGVRAGVGTSLAALARADAWYAAIGEFQPLLLGGRLPLGGELALALGEWGLALAAMPFAGVALLAAWRRSREGGGAGDPALLSLLVWGALLLAATLARRRFGLYLSVPLALWLGLGVAALAARLGRGRPRWAGAAAAGGAIALLVAPALAGRERALAPEGIEARPGLLWLRAVAPEPGREAVLADWPLGHLVQYFAGRPTVATPFGIEGGEGAMETLARLFLAPDERALEAVLAERGAGHVLLGSPANGQAMALGLVPWDGPPPIALVPDAWSGARYRTTEAYWRLPSTQLYFLDGSAAPEHGLGALGGFRLLFESAGPVPGVATGTEVKLFGAVPGAAVRVTGAPPGEPVRAEVAVATASGRSFTWRTFAPAGPDGGAWLRIPWATGPNGLVVAGPVRIAAGGRAAEVAVPEEAVLRGGPVAVALGGGEGP